MTDLISRSKLLSKFNHDDMQTDGNDFVHLNIARRCIESAPTVDAVRVVRCRECKYYGPGPFGMGCNTIFDHRAVVIPRKPDDYCSCGERKEDKA